MHAEVVQSTLGACLFGSIADIGQVRFCGCCRKRAWIAGRFDMRHKRQAKGSRRLATISLALTLRSRARGWGEFSNDESVLGFQSRGMPGQMIRHECRNEVIAMVVAGLQSQVQGDTGLFASGYQQCGLKLAVQEWIGLALIDE